jgi:hypothetical protein
MGQMKSIMIEMQNLVDEDEANKDLSEDEKWNMAAEMGQNLIAEMEDKEIRRSEQMKFYIYNSETLEVVAIAKGNTNQECEEKAALYLGTDEYGATYTPAFGINEGLIENHNPEII